MTSNKASATHSKVQSLIDSGKLHEACRILSSALTTQSDPKLKDLLKHQEETYKYLLYYLSEGYVDNSRKRMLADISATLHFINDSLRRSEILIDSSDIYSSTLRYEKIRKATLSSRIKDFRDAYSVALLAMETPDGIDQLKAADDALSALFSYVWTMYGSSSDDYKLLVEAVCDHSIPFEFRAQVISALLLGNLEYFDRKALNALIDIYEADIDQRITARALVSIVLIIAAHKERVALDPTLADRLSLWSDSIVIYRQLREVIMTIIRAHDTQRISSKMQNEVLPELMKLRPEIIKRLGKLTEGADLEALEENPEWEDIINKNGLGDKLKELTEMQMDGGDVMMLAFSNLKSFPFFNFVANWFMPFSTSHSEVKRLTKETAGAFSEILESEGVMCDSDKYSFIFSLSSMPESQRNMLNSQMASQLNQLKEALADKRMKSSLPEFDHETTRFVRDLYRFFKLYRKKSEFNDPFATPLDFISLPYVGDILADGEILNLVGEFYFKRNYYKEALSLFLRLDPDSSNDHLLWEKIGYCYNNIGQLDLALQWYSKAELFHPDSLWLMKKIALCYRLLNNYKAATEYYLKALEKDPENYHLLMSVAHSLLESGQPEKAVGHYYHADYVKPDRPSTWRGIAWSELLLGNFDKSLDYYHRIMELPDSSATDHLNQGHVYFLLGDYRNAIKSYKRSALHEGYGIDKLEAAIEEDLPVLIKAGGDADNLRLLLEKVKYEL